MTSLTSKEAAASSLLSAYAGTKAGERTPIRDRIALLDSHGKVLSLNSGWPANPITHPDALFRNSRVGVSFIELCRAASVSSEHLREGLRGISAALSGNSDSYSLEYSCDGLTGSLWFRMTVSALHHKSTAFAVVWTDISLQKTIADRAHSLAGRLVNAQEEERRRISRDIHDDVNGRIAELFFLIHRLMASRQQAVDRSDFELLLSKLAEITNVVRRFSHQLHAPQLDHTSLEPALLRLCRDFESSTGIDLTVRTQGELLDVSKDTVVCLYRIVQEALSNIGRHALAKRAHVSLVRQPNEIWLTVSDEGKGFDTNDPQNRTGLGLRSMEERVWLLRGVLQVRSRPGVGTTIEVRVPVRAGSDSTKGLPAYCEWHNEPAA